MTLHSLNLDTLRETILVEGHVYTIYSLPKLAQQLSVTLETLPYSIRVLLENAIRRYDERTITVNDVMALARHDTHYTTEIAFYPTRVLMQDFTGVPAIVDLAAMREAMVALGGNPEHINPLTPVDLVIDHSVQVDQYGHPNAFQYNTKEEMMRNHERYAFLRWGQKAFKHFRVVPPGTGICHQVNLEYLAKVIWTEEKDGTLYAYPDTLVGTDSHTTMINGLSVLGWGVGGIEAEAVMLGQPLAMLIPEVIGVELKGTLPEGATATDIVLTVTHALRKKGVVGKFVEFFGSGLSYLSLADRATIANMAPEYGATCGFFPIDHETINYLILSGRSKEQAALVEAYAKAQGMWYHATAPAPRFQDVLAIDLSTIQPCLAGPKRPQDKVALGSVPTSFTEALPTFVKQVPATPYPRVPVANEPFTLAHGDVVIAAITSCTNTSNPSVMLAAGLVARKARALGITSKPWVKTSLAPGSKVVTSYLTSSGLQADLDALGFHLVGYGCTTCIGNSGPLKPSIGQAIDTHELAVASVLSGNRNFEGRVHPQVKANYLASPPLVVAYALAGTVLIDFTKEPLATTADGKPVFLKDIWPTQVEIHETIRAHVASTMFVEQYRTVFEGDNAWQQIEVPTSRLYPWDERSTYIKCPPYFQGMSSTLPTLSEIKNARILAILGDSITTDHISPAGDIAGHSPAAAYLKDQGVLATDFNSYGARRGNHEVMMRGTFANIRLRNRMVPEKEGGYSKGPSGAIQSIYEAAMAYKQMSASLVILAGKEYGTGSSRDWAAKGTMLLGVKAVIAESFERIHRSNLVGMGVLPCEWLDGVTTESLALTGQETVTLMGITGPLKPGMEASCVIKAVNGTEKTYRVRVRLDTDTEVEYIQQGSILHRVLRQSMTTRL